MGKRTIELTIKDLIDLGIINLKKSKIKREHNKHSMRKPKVKKVKQQPSRDDVFSNFKSSSDHMRGYSSVIGNSRFDPQRYSDPLRLRNTQNELNTRLIESKNQIEDVKARSNDFQKKTVEALTYLSDSIGKNDTINSYDDSGPLIEEVEDEIPLGFSYDDSIGVFGETPGSDRFKSMMEIRPPAAYEDIDEAPKEYNEPFQTPSTSFMSPLGTETVKKVKNRSFLSGLTDAFKPAGRKYDTLAQNPPEEDTFLKRAATTPQQSAAKDVEIMSDDYRHVNKSKVKPRKEEIKLFQDWYVELSGEDAKPDILNSRRRSDIEPEIVKLLVNQYKSLGGAEKKILKSKDSKEVAKEVERLKRLSALNKILE